MLIWRLAAAIAVLAIPVFLITASLRLVTNSPLLYQYGFRAHGSVGRSGLPLDQLLSAADQTRAYFNSDAEPLQVAVQRGGQDVDLYNQREVDHMADVKELFVLARRVEQWSSGSLLAFLGFGLWLGKRRFLGLGLATLYRGGLATFFLVLGAGAAAAVDFERLFLQFHLLSFSNDLWQLDPARDYLIMMYPAGFFRDATIAIAGLAVALGTALALLASLARRALPPGLVALRPWSRPASPPVFDPAPPREAESEAT